MIFFLLLFFFFPFNPRREKCHGLELLLVMLVIYDQHHTGPIFFSPITAFENSPKMLQLLRSSTCKDKADTGARTTERQGQSRALFLHRIPLNQN